MYVANVYDIFFIIDIRVLEILMPLENVHEKKHVSGYGDTSGFSNIHR